MSHTHTMTGKEETFADPFKACLGCGAWVTGYIEFSNGPSLNAPCECECGYKDLCPSWGPVDGCKCPPGAHARPSE